MLLVRLDDLADTDEARMIELPWFWLEATDDIRVEDERSCIEPYLEPPTCRLFGIEGEEGSRRDS